MPRIYDEAQEGGRVGPAAYSLLGSGLVVGLAALAAHALGQPLVFPSLGPTALLLFDTPLAPFASPRNTLIGHAVALGVGVLALLVTGLFDDPSAFEQGVSPSRVVAAALSVAVTGAVLGCLDARHPPSGATTLLVSLGVLSRPPQLAAVAAGVVLVVGAGWLLNRAAGAPVPAWRGRADADGQDAQR